MRLRCAQQQEKQFHIFYLIFVAREQKGPVTQRGGCFVTGLAQAQFSFLVVDFRADRWRHAAPAARTISNSIKGRANGHKNGRAS